MAEGDAGAAFDALVAHQDAAMVVVTAASGEESDGCLVGFHGQVSIHPRRYVVWLSVANRTYRLACDSSHLAVHALGAGDRALAELFGGTTGDDDDDKLVQVDWTAGPGGVPVLAALPFHVVGRVDAVLDVPEGDHVGFVLEPVAGTAQLGRGWEPMRLAGTADIEPGHPA